MFDTLGNAGRRGVLTGRFSRRCSAVLSSPKKQNPAERFRRTVAGKTSGALAYTCLCLVTLVYAVLLEKLPSQILARFHEIFG
ncbi:MAG: hypothetical protein ACREFQ_12270 [Stellaceae bacterium]